MKNVFFLAAFLVTVYLFTSCKPGNKSDRLDDIVKDLSDNNYSLSFDKTYPDFGITKTSYGAESFIAYADPQDVICPEPWRARFPRSRVPIFRIPKIVQPTCPTMIPLDIADKVAGILSKADPTEFAGLKQIKLSNNKNVLLANEKFTSQYTALKADMIDDSVTNGLDDSKFLLLEDFGNLTPGFTRNFYGNANMDDIIKKIDFFHIVRPILIGCFDPQILTSLKDKLAAINPATYQSLQLTRLDQDSTVGVLSLQR
jgi:hypothetical protein